jgi:hypothetical protein
MRPWIFASVLVIVTSWSPQAFAQTDERNVQLGVNLSAVSSGEFDSTDLGVGGRVSWHPVDLLGAEAEVTFYPSDFADEPAFSSSRLEGLFGVTIGPRIGRLRPFAKLRPGFVRFAEAPEPFPCILIFPPPLRCQLAAGETVLALDIGAGIEFLMTERAFARVDVGDRAVRFPGLVLDSDGTQREDAFFSHDFRFQLGGGLRF